MESIKEGENEVTENIKLTKNIYTQGFEILTSFSYISKKMYIYGVILFKGEEQTNWVIKPAMYKQPDLNLPESEYTFPLA